jgi:hypothetical protein
MFRDDYNTMPENDAMKCVWMTSGIISYKLCSLDFTCEDCEFDRVMHNATAPNNLNGPLTTDVLSSGPSSNRLDGSLFYHKNHCWIKVVNPYEVVIGINGILAKLMYGIKTVVLPRVGDQKPGICPHNAGKTYLPADNAGEWRNNGNKCNS